MLERSLFRIGSELPAINRRRPQLVTNPPDDVEFRRHALAALGTELNADGLERRLRDRYPAVRVHPRILTGELRLVWYVYRDGHWVPSRRFGHP